ncbi:hypothetical protein F5J12DRAFT_573775 [Pisolithus orientalis]|uniref:uncharacterized protein n=1 Tax=Pisolithus orientalis TaxID=936130 RepID=UPI002225B5E9|nr:uncharacterized protein F5J12DRAFT_573775 [Pisolithus orientalis]KAI6010964.1 hypothetical protein F5J12DRAFT_573775 [Pisolithus orientalis]
MHFFIPSFPIYTVGTALPSTHDNTPVLDQLILQNCRLPKSLLPSLEKLTTLTLCGEIGHWQLEPQSLRLPLLRSLTIDIDNPSMLVKAIVAPELSCFDFNFDELAAVFGGIPSAFNKVHYVCLRSSTRDPIATVCQAFPNVRHFEMGEHTSWKGQSTNFENGSGDENRRKNHYMCGSRVSSILRTRRGQDAFFQCFMMHYANIVPSRSTGSQSCSKRR